MPFASRLELQHVALQSFQSTQFNSWHKVSSVPHVFSCLHALLSCQIKGVKISFEKKKKETRSGRGEMGKKMNFLPPDPPHLQCLLDTTWWIDTEPLLVDDCSSNYWCLTNSLPFLCSSCNSPLHLTEGSLGHLTNSSDPSVTLWTAAAPSWHQCIWHLASCSSVPAMSHQGMAFPASPSYLIPPL